MGRTPSHLKSLADTRARSAGDIVRLESIKEDVVRQIAAAQTLLDSCDNLIRNFDQRLDPDQIEPIRGFNERYGKRGALVARMLGYLEERWPAEVSSKEMSLMLQVAFKLDFPSAKACRRWYVNSVGRRLKQLAEDGVVARLHDAFDPTVQMGRWRWKNDAPSSLDDLRTHAKAGGVPVEFADATDACDDEAES